MPTTRKRPVQFAEVDPKVIEQQARYARDLAQVSGLSTLKGCTLGQAAPLCDLVREVFGESSSRWVHVPPSTHTTLPP